MTEDRIAAIEAKLDEILELLRKEKVGVGDVMRKKGYERVVTEFDHLEMGARLHNALVRARILTLADFIRVVDTGQIWRIQEIGKVSVQEAYKLRQELK